MNVLPLKNFLFLENNYDIIMVLLKYFKIEKCGPPLPDPFGPLNQQQEANKEVTAALYNYTKHQPQAY